MARMTALVTGASGGLGREYAKICAEEGFDVVLVARNKERLETLKGELEQSYGVKAYACPTDLSREDAACDVFDFTEARHIQVDVLINNAGFGDAGAFAQSDWGKQYRMVQVNIVALMQLTYLYLTPMIARGKGKVLNMSSVAAFSAGPYMSIYYASKGFVRSFSEAVAEEVRGTGVTVTAFCPGPTATGFEKAASMGSGSRMFQKAANAGEVARDGFAAMMRGVALRYEGAFVRVANIGSRLLPRAITRKFARTMNV